MKKFSQTDRLFFLCSIMLCFCMLIQIDAFAQIESRRGVARDGGTIRLLKDIPVVNNPEITGDGTPTRLYVVQLARFEYLDHIPSTFPKNSFLWVNPDHPSEKLLLSGFYDSVPKAKEAAAKWKKHPSFKSAFARETPFMIRYD